MKRVLIGFVLFWCVQMPGVAQFHALQNGQIVVTTNRYNDVEISKTQQKQGISIWKRFQTQREVRRFRRLEQHAILKYHKRLQTRKVRKRMKHNLSKMNKNTYAPQRHIGFSKFGFRIR
jgi:hypothetical protein